MTNGEQGRTLARAFEAGYFDDLVDEHARVRGSERGLKVAGKIVLRADALLGEPLRLRGAESLAAQTRITDTHQTIRRWVTILRLTGNYPRDLRRLVQS